MGFKGVYRTLMELFPQVDSRILKAVAIEHPKNAELAVEVVISEVIPNISQHSAFSSPPYEDCSSSSSGKAVSSPLYEDCSSSSISSGKAEDEERTTSLQYHQVGLEKTVSGSLESRSTAIDDTYKTANAMFESYSSDHEKALSQTTVLSSGTAVDTNQLQGNGETEELILLVRSQNEEESSKSGTSQGPKVISSALPCGEISDTSYEDTVGKCQDTNTKVNKDSVSQTSLESERSGSDGSLTSQFSELKEFGGSSSDEPDEFLGGTCPQSELPNPVEGDIQAEFSSSSKFSHEIQIDILENIVEAAKDHKTTLFLEVESIMNKMREVELQEKIAEQAEEEAVSAGLETLAKVEQLKQMLAHAKEANDMHAGEVYGERSILSTEVKELQARLFSLSDERDKALTILAEMNQTLEARLAVADELKKAAEKEKLEKEAAARSALAEQEAIMEKVVQESKILQQEAEENSRLREFLVDRGHVVDTLQGEISVICHDVRLLKEKFDERVPLSKSISSNQTSCILASSGSSVKALASDPVLQHRETFVSPSKLRSPASSIDGRSPTSTSSIKGKSSNSEENGNMINFDEDDWEFFE